MSDDSSRNSHTELRRILQPAYRCEHFDDICKDTCVWQPQKGLVPRGYGGATSTTDMVRLVLVTSEPGDPGDNEQYEGSASDMMSKAMSYRDQYFARGTLRRNGMAEPYNRNLRTILDFCWPQMDLGRQLERTWLTNSVKCSAPSSGGNIGGAIEKICVATYLKKELALFPHAFVVALGGKTRARMVGCGVIPNAVAMHPSARPTNQPEKTWKAAAGAFRRWLGEAGSGSARPGKRKSAEGRGRCGVEGSTRTRMKNLTGRYWRVNEAFLREKANRDDPRRVFYAAMLNCDTYDEYLAEVGQKLVEVPGFKDNPISGRREILYCRQRGWIEDAVET